MILIALLFILLGVLAKNGRAYYLIAGYNTLIAEEKAEVDIKRLSIVFRNTMFGVVVVITAGSRSSYWLGDPSFEGYGLIIIIVIGVPYLLVKANSDKFRNKEAD